MEYISFDVVVSLLLFLVGVPVLVLQFMSPEIRNVLKVERRIIRVTVLYLALCILIIIVAIFIEENLVDLDVNKPWVWVYMYAALFAVVGFSSVMVLSKYGFRENVIKKLTQEVIRGLARTGKPNEERLRELVEIGKQSDPGPDREMILESMNTLVTVICKHEKYRGDSLENLIIGIVHVLATRPTVEDTRNYQTAAGILTTVLSSKVQNGGEAKYVDQFHAVNAMSTLGQTMLAQDGFSTEADYILMDYEEALGLVVSVHPDLLPDVTQALLCMGSVALLHKRYLFAVATLERMLTLVEANIPVASKPLSDLLGLTAHFWAAAGSSKEFIDTRIERITRLSSRKLPGVIEQARQRFQITMQFDTADKLAQMAKDLKPKPTPRRKKK
ncbi:MAG: hypothetical protein C3F07_20860 [Anaerolineales bacterium]|nr:hypothetical protein [Anaerolineae bacterium]PWB68915.1 MAG: hypothetical protein C3F07_20860 [Anaerolineales bacterium]